MTPEQFERVNDDAKAGKLFAARLARTMRRATAGVVIQPSL
jgi:hypothetical protein